MTAMERLSDPSGFLPAISFFFEIMALILVASQHYSICVQAREISTYTHIFLILVHSFVLPDLLMFALTSLTTKVSIRPFGIVYHCIAGVTCLIACVTLCIGLTFCGNNAQIYFSIGAAFSLVASVVHGMTLIAIRRKLPPSVKFAKS